MDSAVQSGLAQTPDIARRLAAFPLFHHLPQKVIDQLSENCIERRYSAGQTVYSAGQFDASVFFIIEKGVMRASLRDEKSNLIRIEDCGENAVFGLDFALFNAPSAACEKITITAKEDLALIEIDAHDFRALLSQRPTLSRKVTTYFAQELAAARFKTIKSEAAPHARVYKALLQFVERDEESGAWAVRQMPKHRILAQKARVKEAFAASALADLIRQGVVKRVYPGLVIKDMARLHRLAD